MRLLIFCVCAVAFAAKNPDLDNVHTVYLLPMSNSLDQYLANRLTQSGRFQVVTDPQKADAVFSDKIGQGLEDKLNELYPSPEAKAAAEEKSEDKDKDVFGKPMQRFGAFSRGHGTIFLVDRKSRNVVWSIYSPVRNNRADDVNHRAEQIADKLKKDAVGK